MAFNRVPDILTFEFIKVDACDTQGTRIHRRSVAGHKGVEARAK